jgi:hypothetical protein
MTPIPMLAAHMMTMTLLQAQYAAHVEVDQPMSRKLSAKTQMDWRQILVVMDAYGMMLTQEVAATTILSSSSQIKCAALAMVGQQL